VLKDLERQAYAPSIRASRAILDVNMLECTIALTLATVLLWFSRSVVTVSLLIASIVRA
jgi:hypothetical protein